MTVLEDLAPPPKVDVRPRGVSRREGWQRRLPLLIANGAELFAHRIEAVAGEMTQADLGLSAETRDRLAAEVNTIVHCGAPRDFVCSAATCSIQRSSRPV